MTGERRRRDATVETAACGVVCVVLVLAAVVGLVVATGTGLICFSPGSGGPALSSQGPVTISVDHTIYAPTDTVVVTITNHMRTPILLVSTDRCPIIALANLTANTLNPPCTSPGEAGPMVTYIELQPQRSVGARFTSGYSGDHLDTSLTDGTYQVGAQYLPSPFDRANVQYQAKRAIPIPSPTFRVCTCRTC